MTTTLIQVINAAKTRADMVSSSFVARDEWVGFVNASLAELNDIIVSRNVENYVTSSTFTLSNNNVQQLTSSFCKLALVERLGSGDPNAYNASWDTLHRCPFKDRNRGNTGSSSGLTSGPPVRYFIVNNQLTFVPANAASATYRYWYYPKSPVLALDNDTIQDDTQFWWDYVVVDVAIKALNKEESDVSVLMAQKQALKERIESMSADIDSGEPDQVGVSSNDGYGGLGRYSW